MQSDGGNPGNAHGTRRPVTSPGERNETMTKTYTIDNITYTVRTCTAVSVGETERATALYVDYYDESGEHVEYVVFNATMPEDEDEFMILCDYYDKWDSNYRTIATVCFDEGVNIDKRVNDAAKRIRNASSLSECDGAVAIICESAGMLSALNYSVDETIILLKAANLLGVDVNGQWSADPEATELMNHITFVSYTGEWPSLCAGILTLIIDGETVTFGPSTSVEKPMYDRFWRSGGYTNWATGEVVERGWCVCADELPEQYRAYADEIQEVMDVNIPHGCCGGCL